MRIKSIRVCNFKSFKDCTINFNDFNVLIGSNASGKSNLVQIFKFLKDIEEYGLENAISLQGGVEYFTNNQIGASEDFSLEIGLSYGNSNIIPLKNESNLSLFTEGFSYKFSLEFDLSTTQPYRIKEDKVIYKTQLVEITNNDISIKNKKDFIDLEIYFIDKQIVDYRVFKFNTDIIPDQKDLVQRIIQDISQEMKEVMNKELYLSSEKRNDYSNDSLIIEAHFLNSIRQVNKAFDSTFNKVSIFDFDPKLPKKATPITGKIDLEEDGSNLAIVLNKILRDPEKQRKLSNLVTDLLPFIDTLTVEKFADKSLMFKLKETYAKNNEYLPAAFISDGTINIVALIVALYFSNTSFTIIEEPERNLHPSLISKVVEMMKDASKQKQTLVTTHNPEMIKYADLDDILLISRDEDGFSQITRPADSEQVKIFLENEIGMDELYIDNLLG